MSVVFDLKKPNPLSAPCENGLATPPLVSVITSSEVNKLKTIPPEGINGLKVLEPSESNFIELFPTFIIGSFAVPNKKDPTGEPDCLSFYLEEEHLIFIDDGTVALDLLAKVNTSGIMTKPSTAHCLYAFMKMLVTDDFLWLGAMEDDMEKLEEAIESMDENESLDAIMDYRRASMRMGSYYQQLAVMADALADNENRVMTREEAHAFGHVVTRAEHLGNRADVLREYSLQLRELYQTQIDLKQNSTMQILTIVTVMIAPLTVITGWFGMNLTVLPGIEWPYMAGALLIFAAVMICIMLILFKRKKWL
jgi:magnesium transporter